MGGRKKKLNFRKFWNPKGRRGWDDRGIDPTPPQNGEEKVINTL